jgi:BirA family transcriptional regulator, biotin operon repressor / biotin---[acetyl-CoA-carboxylase] ligase
VTSIQHHQNWGAEALWRQLEPLLPGISVEVLARVESTNTRLLERARTYSGQADAPVTRPGELDAWARNTVAGELAPLDGAVASSAARTRHGRRQADVSPCLLVAEEQTRGRGRLGRGWVSSAGASLTFSLAVPLAPVQWGGLSLAVGLALADALEPLAATGDPGGAAPRLMLKWPNDLWLADSAGPAGSVRGPGRKLGGILIETITVGEHRLCVVGVGLNVAPQPPQPLQPLQAPQAPHTAPGELGNQARLGTPVASPVDRYAHGYACLQELEPGLTAPAVLARVAVPLVRALRQFEKHGFAPLVAPYTRRDLLLGRAVSASAPQVMQGVAEGVDEQGALRLRSGGLHRVVSGEVSVRFEHNAQPSPLPQNTGEVA